MYNECTCAWHFTIIFQQQPKTLSHCIIDSFPRIMKWKNIKSIAVFKPEPFAPPGLTDKTGFNLIFLILRKGIYNTMLKSYSYGFSCATHENCFPTYEWFATCWIEIVRFTCLYSVNDIHITWEILHLETFFDDIGSRAHDYPLINSKKY